MNNVKIAHILNTIGDFLEATKNPFRARAYRRAANVISNLKKEVSFLLSKNFDLKELPYVGEGISRIILKISKKEVDPITFILRSQSFSYKIQKPPFRLHNAHNLSLIVIHILKEIIGIKEVFHVGELRRNKELINNLEFLALVTKEFKWKDLQKNSYINNFELSNNHKANLVILNNIPITLHVTNKRNLGRDLLALTGSEQHIQNLKWTFKLKTFNLPDKTEEEIYQHFNLPFIEPELREDVNLTDFQHPKLIQISDIKGDLHCHTNETDGVLDLEKVIEYAMLRGYEYLAITDHSQSLKITRGLDKKRLFNQVKKIDKLNSKLKNFTILKSSECDILEDGSLDFPKDVLKELDLVVCSVHSRFRLSKEQQTSRILRAIENPYCTILGHPTGRLINSRLPYDIDLEKILISAKQHGCILELNCQPYRLDLKDEYCKLAKSLGAKIAISSDAHSLRGFQFIELGITQARRAGLEAKDVINTYSLKAMKKLLRKG